MDAISDYYHITIPLDSSLGTFDLTMKHSLHVLLYSITNIGGKAFQGRQIVLEKKKAVCEQNGMNKGITGEKVEEGPFR